jgi:hypothetical protein
MPRAAAKTRDGTSAMRFSLFPWCSDNLLHMLSGWQFDTHSGKARCLVCDDGGSVDPAKAWMSKKSIAGHERTQAHRLAQEHWRQRSTAVANEQLLRSALEVDLELHRVEHSELAPGSSKGMDVSDLHRNEDSAFGAFDSFHPDHLEMHESDLAGYDAILNDFNIPDDEEVFLQPADPHDSHPLESLLHGFSADQFRLNDEDEDASKERLAAQVGEFLYKCSLCS